MRWLAVVVVLVLTLAGEPLGAAEVVTGLVGIAL